MPDEKDPDKPGIKTWITNALAIVGVILFGAVWLAWTFGKGYWLLVVAKLFGW